MDTEQRLNKLERENRTLKLGGVVLSVSLLALASFAYLQPPVAEAQTSTQRIVAREFSLVNETGEVIGRFGASSDGQPQLFLWEASTPENAGVRAAYASLHLVPHESGGGAIVSAPSSV